ncbi:MAG: hypothetical protein OES13_10865 [Acidimicrobiia bacterium]|nr:hypothetical protein [Acidimicrobiia bacterium]
MGQQPNIEITLGDLPIAKAQPEAARRWSPTRPGELSEPDAVPWGGAFGTPGPDAGYARTLASKMELPLVAGERQADAEVAIAALASARASHFGRAPVGVDVAIAAIILCYDRSGIPAAVADRIAQERGAWVGDMARQPHNASKLVAAVPLEVLVSTVDEVRAAVADGAVL